MVLRLNDYPAEQIRVLIKIWKLWKAWGYSSEAAKDVEIKSLCIANEFNLIQLYQVMTNFSKLYNFLHKLYLFIKLLFF